MQPVQERPLGAAGKTRLTAVYGLAHFGKSQLWSASEVLFAYFLTEVGGLPGRDMGLVLAAGYLCGAVADVLAGVKLASALSSARAAAALQLIGAAVSASALMLLFLATEVPAPARLAWTLVTGLAFRIGYMLIDLPQNALLSVATPDGPARSRVAAVRLFFSGAAGLCVSASLGPLLTADIGLGTGARYLLFGAALSLVVLASALALRQGLSTHAPPSPPPRTKSPSIIVALKLMPPSVWKLTAVIFVISAAASFSRIEPYYAAYVLRSPAWGSAVLVAFSLGAMVSQPLWALLAQRVGRATALTVGASGFIASAAALWGFALHPPAAVGCALLLGAASAGIGTTLWAAFADVADAECRGREGLAFGLLTAGAKLALAAGVLIGGEVLGKIDYEHAESHRLVDLMCLPSIVGGLLALAIIRWWGATVRTRAPL